MSQLIEKFSVKGALLLLALVVGQYYIFLLRKKLKQKGNLNSKAMKKKIENPQPIQGELTHEDEAGATLDIMFMFSGHAWEAHEILGVNPSDGLESIEQAYIELKEKVDKDSTEILDLAYRAIVASRKQK